MRIVKYLIYLAAMAVLFPGASCEKLPPHLRPIHPFETSTIFCDSAISDNYHISVSVQVIKVDNPSNILINWSCTNGGILDVPSSYTNSNGIATNTLTIPSFVEDGLIKYKAGKRYKVTASATIDTSYEEVTALDVVVWHKMHIEYDYQANDTDNCDIFLRSDSAMGKMDRAFNEAYTEVHLVKDDILSPESLDYDEETSVQYYCRAHYDTIIGDTVATIWLAGVSLAKNRPDKVGGISIWNTVGNSVLPYGESIVFVDDIQCDAAIDNPTWPANSGSFYDLIEKTTIHELGHTRGGLHDKDTVFVSTDGVMHKGYLVDTSTGKLERGNYLWEFCPSSCDTISKTTW